jgi:hypothetical protein
MQGLSLVRFFLYRILCPAPRHLLRAKYVIVRVVISHNFRLVFLSELDNHLIIRFSPIFFFFWLFTTRPDQSPPRYLRPENPSPGATSTFQPKKAFHNFSHLLPRPNLQYLRHNRDTPHEPVPLLRIRSRNTTENQNPQQCFWIMSPTAIKLRGLKKLL